MAGNRRRPSVAEVKLLVAIDDIAPGLLVTRRP
jgi:hypothetical protein